MKKEKKPKKEKTGEKGGKKKLLLIPIVLLLVAAIGAAVVLFVLPRFGINLLGGGSGDSSLEEPLPKKGLEAYTLGEDTTISLDTLLEEGEGALIAFRKPDPANKSEGSSSSASSSAEPDPGVPTYTYIYDVASPAAIVDRYLDAVLGGEEKFVLVDETFLHLEERPVLEDAVGSVTIARASVQEGHVFQMVIGWSDASALTFRTSAPEGEIHEPEKNPGGGLGSEVIETVPVTAQIEKIKGMSPSQLGLDGESMEEYEIFPVEGFVKVDGLDCRRFNLYRRVESGGGHYPDLEGIIMLSADQEHIYWLDPESNAGTELR